MLIAVRFSKEHRHFKVFSNLFCSTNSYPSWQLSWQINRLHVFCCIVYSRNFQPNVVVITHPLIFNAKVYCLMPFRIQSAVAWLCTELWLSHVILVMAWWWCFVLKLLCLGRACKHVHVAEGIFLSWWTGVEQQSVHETAEKTGLKISYEKTEYIAHKHNGEK